MQKVEAILVHTSADFKFLEQPCISVDPPFTLLLYHPYLVCILFGVPSLHLFIVATIPELETALTD